MHSGKAHGSLLTAIKGKIANWLYIINHCVACCSAHGGVNSLRKASTDNTSKQELPELGPFGSQEALDLLDRATRLVLWSP